MDILFLLRPNQMAVRLDTDCRAAGYPVLVRAAICCRLRKINLIKLCCLSGIIIIRIHTPLATDENWTSSVPGLIVSVARWMEIVPEGGGSLPRLQ